MNQLSDPVECRKVTDCHPDFFTFDVEAYFENPLNYCLIEGRNIAFADYKSPGVYWVHFCFDEARGREAIELTKKMFKKLCEETDIRHAIGLIELRNKKARWLIRQVGFVSLGEVTTENGECEMFYHKRID